MKHATRLIVVLFLAPMGALAQTSITNIAHTPASAGTFQKIEVTFSLGASYANPYNDAEVDARLEVETPDHGTYAIPAFWYVGYNRFLNNGEKFSANGIQTWMARFVGQSPGLHRYRVLVTDAGGDAASPWQEIQCFDSGDPGFVRVDPRDGNFMAFDDGSPYIPIGHNVCWGVANGSFQVIDHLNKMAVQGENWTRFWMANHTSVSQGLEWITTQYNGEGLGRMSQRIASKFDAMLAVAQQHGIYTQLCLDSYNAWNYDTWANWTGNPYNVANGGMLQRPADYLTNPQAKELAKRRFRYTVARWAYNPAILCWEFFNEIDAMGAGGHPSGFWINNLADGVAWHQEMAQYIRSIDPYNHLRTTSFVGNSSQLKYPEIWELPEMDIVQTHRYSPFNPAHHIEYIRQARAYGKPVIQGEWGMGGVPSPHGLLGKKPDALDQPIPLSIWWGPDKKANLDDAALQYSDSSGQTLHDGIWGLALVGSSAMSWWWLEWIDPGNLYPVFNRLIRFMEGEDWAAHNLRLGELSLSVLSSHDIDSFGSQGWNHAYLWIRRNSGASTGLTLELADLIDGEKQLEFWNTYTGQIIATQTVSVIGGKASFTVPSFQRDIAIKVIGAAGAPTPTPTITPTPTPRGDNLLHNPGGEEGSLEGWTSWEEWPWAASGVPDYPGRAVLELFTRSSPDPTFGELFGLYYFGAVTGYASARGGMYQEVDVIPGNRHRLAVYGATGPDDERLSIGWIDGTQAWVRDQGIPGDPVELDAMPHQRPWTLLQGEFVPSTSPITIYADWRHNYPTGVAFFYLDNWDLEDLDAGSMPTATPTPAPGAWMELR